MAATPAGAGGRATDAGPAIAVHGLVKRYGDVTAVDNLDLEIPRGEVFGLLGPNGAGKTTTILTLLGLSEPTAGSVEVLGLDPTRRPLDVKRRVGYLPESVGFYGDLSGRENLRYTARLNRLDRAGLDDRVEVVLRQVGLADAADTRAGAYSHGMRQRLGIADALVKDPEVLILDEPTIGIDPEGVDDILALIRSLPDERGVTVLLSSHLLYQVQAICDRVGIFVRGRLVADGPIEELARRLSRQVTIEVGVADGDPVGPLRRTAGVVGVVRDGDLWLVTADADVRAELAAAVSSAGLALTHLARRGAALDQIYRRYFEPADTAPARPGGEEQRHG